MPRGAVTQTRSFIYNGGDLISLTNPENGTVTWQYNGSHQVSARTDALGQRTEYTYDTYGRLTQVRHYAWVNGALQEDVSQRVDHDYDSNPFLPGYSQYAWGAWRPAPSAWPAACAASSIITATIWRGGSRPRACTCRAQAC
jgi:YD repeat-containing protein